MAIIIQYVCNYVKISATTYDTIVMSTTYNEDFWGYVIFLLRNYTFTILFDYYTNMQTPS